MDTDTAILLTQAALVLMSLLLTLTIATVVWLGNQVRRLGMMYKEMFLTMERIMNRLEEVRKHENLPRG